MATECLADLRTRLLHPLLIGAPDATTWWRVHTPAAGAAQLVAALLGNSTPALLNASNPVYIGNTGASGIVNLTSPTCTHYVEVRCAGCLSLARSGRRGPMEAACCCTGANAHMRLHSQGSMPGSDAVVLTTGLLSTAARTANSQGEMGSNNGFVPAPGECTSSAATGLQVSKAHSRTGSSLQDGNGLQDDVRTVHIVVSAAA